MAIKERVIQSGSFRNTSTTLINNNNTGASHAYTTRHQHDSHHDHHRSVDVVELQVARVGEVGLTGWSALDTIGPSQQHAKEINMEWALIIAIIAIIIDG